MKTKLPSVLSIAGAAAVALLLQGCAYPYDGALSSAPGRYGYWDSAPYDGGAIYGDPWLDGGYYGGYLGGYGYGRYGHGRSGHHGYAYHGHDGGRGYAGRGYAHQSLAVHGLGGHSFSGHSFSGGGGGHGGHR